MIRKSKEEILKTLKKAGYRMTKHRQAIISIIAKRQDHPSVRQIYDQIRRKEPEISLATVYNIVNMLVEMKILRKIEFEESDNCFDTNLAPHINLVCTVCGSINDFEYDIPVASEVIQAQEGFVTKEYRIEYRGICNNCQRKK